MRFRTLISGLVAQLKNPTSSRRRLKVSGLPIEQLEARLVLTNAWPSPQLVTISFEPDGTDLGGVSSNLTSSFNSSMGTTGAWQAEIMRAAQVWAQQTNLNFVLASDSGAAIGSGAYQQGSSTIGDIRIGGYNFGSSTLAQAFLPPPVDNFSIAGDIQFNTSITYGIGNFIDLFTVASHEFGHALGLDHS